MLRRLIVERIPEAVLAAGLALCGLASLLA
jgi:hypothetical protein